MARQYRQCRRWRENRPGPRRADETGTVARSLSWQGGRAQYDRRIRIDDLSPLRRVPQDGASRAEDQIHRYRPSPADLARVPAGPARGAGLDGGALRRTRSLLPDGRRPVRNAENWVAEGGEGTEKLLQIAKQAGFTKEKFDQCIGDKALFEKILE